jgi:hypothetical protein
MRTEQQVFFKDFETFASIKENFSFDLRQYLKVDHENYRLYMQILEFEFCLFYFTLINLKH